MKIREVDWSKIKTDSAYNHKLALEEYSEQAIKDTGSNFLAIEIGSNYGATAAVLSQYFKYVIAVDSWYLKLEDGKYDNTRLNWQRILDFYDVVKEHELFNVVPVLSTSNALGAIGSKATLAFIDGDHSEAAVSLDIENIDKCLTINSKLVFHDYHRTWPEVVLAVDNSKILADNYQVFEKRDDGMICFTKVKL